jgi:phospholipase C
MRSLLILRMRNVCSVLAGLVMIGCGGGGGGGQTDGGAGSDGGVYSCSIPGSSTLDTQRDSCTFKAGSSAVDTLGVPEATRAGLPIKHVIVLMKENRSFDHLFGQLSVSTQPQAEPVPATFANLDATGASVPPFHLPATCWPYDPHHQWTDMHAQVDGGKMDGFVTNAAANNDPYPPLGQTLPPTDGHFVMGYYDQADLPFYYWLAGNFALADRYFASVQSGTWANRDYLVAATSNGTKDTETDPQLAGVPLIFDELDTANVSWQVYTNDFAPLEFSVSWTNRKPWGKVDDVFTALAAGTLPQVAFVDATTSFTPPETDEHPPADVQLGEDWTRTLVAAVVASPLWSSSVLFYTYDEAGGYADHVPPPSSCAPSADQAEFTELGVRVPLIAISPYAKRQYVSHTVHQHTSILRFIELLYGVPALTARDANSDALLDLFDFCATPTTAAALGPLPLAGTGGCPAM